MNPSEFSDVDLGYYDLETGEEIIVYLPESSSQTLISNKLEPAGYVYAVGNSVDNKVGIYRLENRLLDGTGKFSPKNIEGLSGSPKAVRDSLNAAFNYFTEKSLKLIGKGYDDFDYTLYFNDLQNRGVSEEVSVAEVVALFSALSGRPVANSIVICGRVVMSGSMMPLTTELDEVVVASENAGARKIFLPADSEEKYMNLSEDIRSSIVPVFYKTPLEAVKKALEIE